jgi:hypothetical protein
MEGLVVPTGAAEDVEVAWFVLILNGGVSAASIEREKSPAIRPPRIHMPIKVMPIQRKFILFLR